MLANLFGLTTWRTSLQICEHKSQTLQKPCLDMTTCNFAPVQRALVAVQDLNSFGSLSEVRILYFDCVYSRHVYVHNIIRYTFHVYLQTLVSTCNTTVYIVVVYNHIWFSMSMYNMYLYVFIIYIYIICTSVYVLYLCNLLALLWLLCVTGLFPVLHQAVNLQHECLSLTSENHRFRYVWTKIQRCASDWDPSCRWDKHARPCRIWNSDGRWKQNMKLGVPHPWGR